MNDELDSLYSIEQCQNKIKALKKKWSEYNKDAVVAGNDISSAIPGPLHINIMREHWGKGSGMQATTHFDSWSSVSPDAANTGVGCTVRIDAPLTPTPPVYSLLKQQPQSLQRHWLKLVLQHQLQRHERCPSKQRREHWKSPWRRSSSEDERDVASGADEQWDDMAIVRAFEDALNDQRQRTGAATKTQKAKNSRSARKQSRRVSVDDEDVASSTTPAAAATTSPAYGYTGATSNGYQQDFAAQPQFQANGYAMPNASEHGSQNDIYQLAYAQAYASLQAQFQAAAHQPAPTPYPTGYGYGAQQAPGYPSYPSQQHFQPQMPQSMPMPPFPTVPGVNGAPGASDDGLSNLLLAWYQSGYYTGRFQAMQEMKARSHR